MTRTVVTSALTGLAAGAAGAALTHALLPGKSAPAAVPTTENATEKAATGTTGAPAAAAVATAVPAGAVPAAAKPEDPIVTGARAGDAAALRILRERATQGDAQAQLHMGQLLAAGTGVSPDHTQARKWLLVAAEKLPPGPDKAKAEEEAVRVGLQMTPEARTEADKQAHEFKSQPAPAAATPVPAAQ
jgi:TPR repeat protein